MTDHNTGRGALAAVPAVLVAATQDPLAATGVEDLIMQIRNPDERVNGPACQNAGSYGAAAIQPLAALLEEQDFETARRAKRALYRVVRHASAPGESTERRAVELALIEVLNIPSSSLRREVLWMLSEIGEDTTVGAVSGLLSDQELREDARCCLLRIPGAKSTAALKAAFESAPEEFKYALADSLRIRGEALEAYPSRKLSPRLQTSVTVLEKK